MKPPYDSNGRFVSRDCPEPDCGGTLQLEKDGFFREWRCDGLIPDENHMALDACTYTFTDGETVTTRPEIDQ